MDELSGNQDCTIRTYAGYKGDEVPRSLVLGGKEWPIERILSRRRVCDSESGRLWDEFECRVGQIDIRIKIYSTGEQTFSSLS